MPAPTTKDPDAGGVLVEHWETILWRASCNWAAWLSAILPDVLVWVLEHLDLIPKDLMTPEQKNVARIVLVSIAVPAARSWKQRGLRRALAEKDAQLAPPVSQPLKGDPP